jgi:F0F1-type ATP synthase assembly protein I
MGKVLAIFFGLVSMIGGVLLVLFIWGPLVLDFIFACIPLILFFGGLIAFVAGISSMKDAARAKALEAEAEAEFGNDLDEEEQTLVD